MNKQQTDQDANDRTGKRLFRSSSDRVFAGVCGGLAEYFVVDALLVRLAWVVFSLVGGAGLIGYIIAMIVIPKDSEKPITTKTRSTDGAKLAGYSLIIIGLMFLLKQMGVFYYFQIYRFPWQLVLALLLIGLGAYIIFHDKNSDEPFVASSGIFGRLVRIHEGKMLAGVCMGLATYFNIDVTIMRLIWVIVTLSSGGLGILAYIFFMIVLPYDSQKLNAGD